MRGGSSVIVAEGEGEGALLRAEMTIRRSCQKMNRRSVLAFGSVGVNVKFGSNKHTGGAESTSIVDDREDEEFRGEESATRKSVSTQNPDPQRVPDDPETGTNRDASDGLNKVRNIPKHVYFVGRSVSNTSEETTGDSPGNLINDNVSPVDVAVAVQEPKTTEADSFLEEPLASRPLANLEVGMYVLLCVFCLAILAFLSNLVLHLVRSRRRPSVPEQIGRNWMWLRTDAQELIVNGALGVAEISTGTGVKSCHTSTVAAVTVDLDTSRPGYITIQPGGSESPPKSPTSRRKKVQFTTFASMDRLDSPGENGHGIPGMGNDS